MKSILVVGHGLAGAILAHTLIDRGINVTCVEGELKHTASRIAAGLINPFIGPKLNLPFAFQNCIESNLRFFKKWENEFSEILFKPESLFRVFNSEKQAIIWSELAKKKKTSRYALSFLSCKELKESKIQGEHGAGKTQAFRLNIKKFLQFSRQKLKSMNCWNQETFSYTDANKEDAIIFAEGYNVSGNPYFNWLPFAPAQGEILEFSGPMSPALSNGTWFLPNQKSHYLAGSTWKHHELKSGPTKIGQDLIYENLKYMPISRYEIINHFSGIRSGTKDRNPIIGQHPRISNLYIFNGFGSRGSTTIKFHADHLAELITRGVKLPEYIDLNRFVNIFPS